MSAYVRPVAILPPVGLLPAGQYLYPIVTDGTKQPRDLRGFCQARRQGMRCGDESHSSKRDCEFGLRNCPFIVE